MEPITLNIARKIMLVIEGYKGPMNSDALIASVAELTMETPKTVAAVIEFLMEVHKVQPPELTITEAPPPPPPAVINDEPLNLMDELAYNYKVAKRCLETSLVEGRILDADETRKSLRTISTFMEQALKLQERLYNAQQIQKFQDAVLDLLGTADPQLRDNLLTRMLDA